MLVCALLEAIGSTFQKMIDSGARLVRLLGNLGWGHEGWPAEDSILEFEAWVTRDAKAFPCVVVCMYDVRSLSGRVMHDAAFALSLQHGEYSPRRSRVQVNLLFQEVDHLLVGLAVAEKHAAIPLSNACEKKPNAFLKLFFGFPEICDVRSRFDPFPAKAQFDAMVLIVHFCWPRLRLLPTGTEKDVSRRLYKRRAVRSSKVCVDGDARKRASQVRKRRE